MGSAHLFLGSIFVLGEGEGGTEGGRVESRLAVSSVLANFRSSTQRDPGKRLVEAITHAGEVLHARTKSGPAFNGAWARCIAVLLSRGRLYAARVGDLRICRIRDGQLSSVFSRPWSTDTPRPGLGEVPVPDVDYLDEPLLPEPGDRLVLANEPLFTALNNSELGRISATLVPAVAARRLVEAVERAGDIRPIGVQVIQLGASFGEDRVEATSALERNLHESRTSYPKPAPIAVKRKAKTRKVKTMPPVLVPPSALGPRNKRSSRRSLLWAAGVMLLFGAAGHFFFGQTSTEAAVDRSGTTVPGDGLAWSVDLSAEPSDEFWARVSERLRTEGATLDPAEVRLWLKDSEEVARRLREADAVHRALQTGWDEPVLPADEEPGPVVELEIAGLGGASTEPDEESVPGDPIGFGEEARGPDELDSAVVQRGAPLGYDPSTLPAGLRPFEAIFSLSETDQAGERLRNYIHRRHRRAEQVFRNLDVFLERAPIARSIDVLMATMEHQPGPMTRRWCRQRLSDLRAQSVGSTEE